MLLNRYDGVIEDEKWDLRNKIRKAWARNAVSIRDKNIENFLYHVIKRCDELKKEKEKLLGV